MVNGPPPSELKRQQSTVRVELGFLETKVARRLLFLFVFSAVLPLSALAIFSYLQVAQRLEAANATRLAEISEQTQATLQERLRAADAELNLTATALSQGLALDQARVVASRSRALSAVSLSRGDRNISPLAGDLTSLPELSEKDLEHLRSGLPLLKTAVHRGATELYIARAVTPGDAESPVLWGRLSAGVFWSNVAIDPFPGGELCVIDQSMEAVHGAPTSPAGLRLAFQELIDSGGGPAFSWRGDGAAYEGVALPLFLGQEFRAPSWHVVISVPRDAATASVREFTQRFLPIALTALLIILLLSDIQIRRTIQPLKRLKEGTRRIADEDFDATVEVSSNDEFQELADSFNSMAKRLGEQIGTLTVISEVDRAALEEAEGPELIAPLLRGMRSVLKADTISICLLDAEDPSAGSCYTVQSANEEPVVDEVSLEEGDLDQLRQHPLHLLLPAGEALPPYLEIPALEHLSGVGFVSLPLVLRRGPAGVISFAADEGPTHSDAQLLRARQIADQLALALSNVRRLRALDRFNWGALTALARTIDANSKWTAGHSERVAEFAVTLGERMGLAQADLDVLHRGALLHDIGKIGVPVALVNKPGKLTDEEMSVIREHPVIGARILEPITEYADLLPLVRHHHERIDGRGYPDQLRGESIPLLARILGVADTFDALTSDRPYRRGLALRTATEVVKNAAGTQLDADVVATFLALVEDGVIKELKQQQQARAKERTEARLVDAPDA